MLTTTTLDTVNEKTSTSTVYGFIVLIGIGAGMFIQASFSVAQAKVTKDRAADAAGFISLAQNLGIALALAISGSIFQNKAVDGLRSVLPLVPTAVLRNAVSGANSNLFQTLAPDVGPRVLAVIVDAMSYTYVLVITAGALSIVGSLFMSVSCLASSLVTCTSRTDDWVPFSENDYSCKQRPRDKLYSCYAAISQLFVELDICHSPLSFERHLHQAGQRVYHV